MHDIDEHTTSDEASNAIRDALPTIDPSATERIAMRIDDGMQSRDRSRTRTGGESRRRRGRRGGVIRPALATGAVLVAGAVALLAPGQDEAGRGLGPQLAAAEVLHAAGVTASDEPWHALRDGEYHYTVNSWINPMRRVRLVEHRWLAADGTGTVEVREQSMQPEGTRYWTPALDCSTVMSVPSPMTQVRTVDAGNELPACWTKAGVLASAVGEIVDAPPAGALVDGVDVYGAEVRGDLTWGSTVTEAPGPPPGATETRDTEGNVVDVQSGPVSETAPARMPLETTWVQVVAGEHVTFRGPLLPQPSPFLGGFAWNVAFANDVEHVPSRGVELLATLRAKASAEIGRQTAEANGTEPASVPGSVDQAVVSMATNLLSHAPLSPGQRRAAFDALATLAGESDATVERDAELPDGGEGAAVRISFVEEPPAVGDGTTPIGFQTDIYLDQDTSELRAVAFGSEDSPRYVTSWERSQRVTSLELPRD